MRGCLQSSLLCYEHFLCSKWELSFLPVTSPLPLLFPHSVWKWKEKRVEDQEEEELESSLVEKATFLIFFVGMSAVDLFLPLLSSW